MGMLPALPGFATVRLGSLMEPGNPPLRSILPQNRSKARSPGKFASVDDESLKRAEVPTKVPPVDIAPTVVAFIATRVTDPFPRSPIEDTEPVQDLVDTNGEWAQVVPVNTTSPDSKLSMLGTEVSVEVDA
jgi:hypothetical protein